MFRIFLAGLLALIGAPLAFADCNATACWDETVDLIYPASNGTIYVEFSGDQSSLDCSLHSGRFFVFSVIDSYAEYFFSALLTAQARLEPISRIKAKPGTGICTLSYVQLGPPQN